MTSWSPGFLFALSERNAHAWLAYAQLCHTHGMTLC
jgi:hypothetical protein